MSESVSEDDLEEKRKILKDTNKKIWLNMLSLVLINIYLVIIYAGYQSLTKDMFYTALQVTTMIMLFVSIIFFEIAYKKQSKGIALNGIEFLVLATYSLSISYVIESLKFNFNTYVLSCICVATTYFIFKNIIIFTLGRKKYLNSLSDISEIVKKEEPKKKVATKKNNQED